MVSSKPLALGGVEVRNDPFMALPRFSYSFSMLNFMVFFHFSRMVCTSPFNVQAKRVGKRLF